MPSQSPVVAGHPPAPAEPLAPAAPPAPPAPEPPAALPAEPPLAPLPALPPLASGGGSSSTHPSASMAAAMTEREAMTPEYSAV
jgi:hypothetical protein